MSAQFRKITYIVFLVLALSLTGCLGGPKPTEPSYDLEYTQAAETIFAEMTQNAPSVTLTPEQLPETQPPDEQSATEAPATPTMEPLPPTSTPLPTNTPLPSDTPVPPDTPVPTDTPEPTSTPTPTEPEFELVNEDDFAYARGWAVESNEDFKMGYEHGGYAISLDLRNDLVWSVRSQLVPNVRLEIDATRLEGSRDGSYGLVCRHENGFNYYYLYVGSDGSYGIAKKTGGILTYLHQGQDTENIVYTGNTPNHIRADCLGNKLTLYINGFMMASVEDSDFTGGSVGMAAGTGKTGGYKAFFDNFAVYEPK